MSNLSLNIGLKSLLTAQAALENIGHNVANANTPGYSRQDLIVRSSRSLELGGILRGNGVDAVGVRRVTDEVLTKRLSVQVSVVSRLRSSLDGMSSIEALISEPGDQGIGALLDNFFQTVSSLSANPQDLVLRNGTSQAAQNLTGQFNQMADSIEQLQQDAAGNLRSYVGEVNRLAEEVRSLNVEIGRTEASGLHANDLRDRRDRALKDLSEVISVDVQEKPSGVVHVLLQGQLLVGSSSLHPVQLGADTDGRPQLRVSGGVSDIEPTGGRMGGIMRFLDDFVPGVQADLDRLARAIVLDVNRAHSTGTSPQGGYALLTGSQSLLDTDGNSDVLGELLVNTNSDFPVQGGELFVNVTKESTGEVMTHRIEIDPTHTTVSDFLQALSDVPNVHAGLDSLNRVSIFADSGHRFDFSRRLDEAPDDIGSFGGGRASLASAGGAPFALTAGATLDLAGPLSSFSIAFQAGDFEDITAASAREIADVINANPDAIQNQIRAEVVADRVVLQSAGTGPTSSFDVTGGSSLAEFGWNAGSTVSGHESVVDVHMSGVYEGDQNQTWHFRPLSDGEIGSTPGLQVAVTTADGLPVATLNVGDGYLPGTPIEVADGLQISLSFGVLSASDNDIFEQHVVADSDTSDVLVALGMNAFFEGTDAKSMQVSGEIVRDPSRIAASATGAVGDAGTLLDILSLQTSDLASLGGSVSEFYASVVGDIGFEVSTTESAAEVEGYLLESLEARREEVAGVNVDEELVDMIRFEQAFGAAAQFIQVVQSLGDTLLQLL